MKHISEKERKSNFLIGIKLENYIFRKFKTGYQQEKIYKGAYMTNDWTWDDITILDTLSAKYLKYCDKCP